MNLAESQIDNKLIYTEEKNMISSSNFEHHPFNWTYSENKKNLQRNLDFYLIFLLFVVV